MILVIGSFIAGMVLRRVRSDSESLVHWADRWVIQIALPCLVVAQMVSIELDDAVLFPVASAWTAMSVSAFLVMGVARVRRWSATVTGALLLVAVLGNTSFLGLGVVEARLGTEALASAVAYDQPGTFLALATWGSFVAAPFGTTRSGAPERISRSQQIRAVVRRVVTFAPFVALVVSVPLRAIEIPESVFDVARTVGKTVAPVAMCALGLRFRTVWSRRIAPFVGAGLLIKMISAPVVVSLLALAWDANDTAVHAAITQASAPPMVTAGIVAIAAGCDEELVTSLVGWGTLIGFAWMPLVAAVVSNLM